MTVAAPAIWQEVEFGSYTADLSLWVELAEAAHGPVLELGAGAGRVALHLAEQGHDVVAVERDGELAEELERAAESRGLPVEILDADLAAAETLSLRASPSLAIGPLHVVQVLDEQARPRLLHRLAELLAPEATLALTLVDESTLLSAGAASTQILPDMRELDGWVYSSEPLWVQVADRVLTIRRLRERVSPEGRMEREVHDEHLHRVGPDELEAEAEVVGFCAGGRRQISSGPNEADSIAILLEAPG